MKQNLTTLLLLSSMAAGAQSAFPHGAHNIVDSNYSSCVFDTAVFMPLYADPDSSTVLAVDARGKLYNKVGGGGGGNISSVFGRTGAITAQTGDYSSFYVPIPDSILYYSTQYGQDTTALNARAYILAQLGNYYTKIASDARYLQTAVTSVTAGAGLSGGTITTTGTISMATVNATPGGYGSNIAIPVVTVNALGQITNQATVTPTPAWSNITGTPATISGYNIGLTNDYFWMGNGGGVPTAVQMSGSATMSNTGVITVSSAATCITIPNLTGDVTSVGNTTSYSNTVPVSKGGLNKTSATQYDIPYATSTTVYGAIGIGSANQLLAVNSGATGYTWVAPGGTGTVTSVGLSVPSVFSVSGTPVTTSGTLGIAFNGGQTANEFLATPNGSSGPVGLRAIAVADVPTLNQNTTGNAATSSVLSPGANIDGTNYTGASNITISAAPVKWTSVKTSSYTPVNYDGVPCDVSGGNFSCALPATPADQTICEFKIIKESGTNTVTINAGGSDVFNIASGATSFVLSYLNQAVLLEYNASAGIWYINDIHSKNMNDALYAPISVAGSVTSVTAGTGLSGGTITTTGTISMPNTGTSGTYGSTSQIPVFATDAQGRVTSVTNTTPSLPVGDITGISGTSPINYSSGAISFQSIPATSVPANTTGGSATPSGNIGYSTSGTSANTLVEANGQANISTNNVLGQWTTTTGSSAATITMTSASAGGQIYSGSSTETYVLPAVSGLSLNFPFYFINTGIGTMVITSSGNNTVFTVSSGGSLNVMSNATSGTSASVWTASPGYPMASANTANTGVLRDGSGNFTAGTITAALTGNASTASVLTPGANINGVAFTGASNITVAAAAGTLTGGSLASGVTASSLTSFGSSIALGTPGSGALTNCTGLPISTGVSGLGTGIATFLATPNSANFFSAITDESGSGSVVGQTNPTFNGFTITDGDNILFGTSTGTKIGTATTQKIGFYNAAPVAQPAAGDVATTMATLGLMASGGTYTAASISVGTLANGMTATTQAHANNSTDIATTAYVNTYAQPMYATATALTPGTTVTWTPTIGTNIYTLTPAQNETINMGTIPSGCVGEEMVLSILTSGTTSYTLTWGTNLHPQATTLVTGTTTGKYFVMKVFVLSTTLVLQESITTAE